MIKKFKDITLNEFIKNYEFNPYNKYLKSAYDGAVGMIAMLGEERANDVFKVTKKSMETDKELVELYNSDFIVIDWVIN